VQKNKVNILLWSVVFLIGISLSSCLKTTEPQPQKPTAYISIMNLATATPAYGLDIYFNDSKASSTVWQPGTVPVAYSPINKDVYKIDLKKTGSDSVITTVPSNLYDSLHFYSVVAYNPSSTSNEVKSMLIEDNFSNLSLDKTFFRFWHFSPAIAALGPVDLYIDNSKVSSQRTLGDNEFSDYQNLFQTTTAGNHSITIKLSNRDTTIYQSTSDVSFQSGNAYTLYLMGKPGGEGANKLNVGSLRAANN